MEWRPVEVTWSENLHSRQIAINEPLECLQAFLVPISRSPFLFQWMGAITSAWAHAHNIRPTKYLRDNKKNFGVKFRTINFEQKKEEGKTPILQHCFIVPPFHRTQCWLHSSFQFFFLSRCCYSLFSCVICCCVPSSATSSQLLVAFFPRPSVMCRLVFWAKFDRLFCKINNFTLFFCDGFHIIIFFTATAAAVALTRTHSTDFFFAMRILSRQPTINNNKNPLKWLWQFQYCLGYFATHKN